MSKKKEHLFNEFTILGAFVVVALSGLIVGSISLIIQANAERDSAPEATAPTARDYRAEAKAVITPFLGQAAVISQGVFPEGTDTAMSDLVDLTQERLLGLTVPASEREVHLSMVILLDQWRRALNGTDRDMAGVIARTDKLLIDYPWLTAL